MQAIANDNLRQCQVAILAGGAGTRLKSRTGGLPKPMALLNGLPVLEHLVKLCSDYGFIRIAFLVHYEHEIIKNYFGNGCQFGVSLSYCVESEARGTAGALFDALPVMEEHFLVLYGDTFADVNLQKIWANHATSGADATLLLHPNDHPYDSDLVEVDGKCRVLKIHPYPHQENEVHANLVNAALYVMNRDALKPHINPIGKYDLAKHTFPAMLSAGCYLNAVITPEYIKDMGTPDRLDKIERDIFKGLPDSLSSRHLRKAVFIDRDGTLNEELNHISTPSKIRLLPGSADAVRKINRSGMLAVCVTNQPVVARGEVTIEQLKKIHATLDSHLGKEKAYLDRLYFCPHHPDRGYPGEIEALKIVCNCRKPATDLIDRAVRELEIDRGASWMVGDTSADIRCGMRSGLRTILVRTGHAGRDNKWADEPDYVVPDLSAAVDWILNGYPVMKSKLLPVAAAAVNTKIVLIAGPARAGKSSASRVLAELLAGTGRNIHVICADGWLKPPEQRPEGSGVLERFDVVSLTNDLKPLLLMDEKRNVVSIPIYDRDTRQVTGKRKISVGSDDLIIVEGVICFMVPALLQASGVRLLIDTTEIKRRERLRVDYSWRSQVPADLDMVLDKRENDEILGIRACADQATHRINFE